MEVAVIGAGPAGIGASIQLAKEGLVPVLYERDEPGGMLRYANRIDNMPGTTGSRGSDVVGSLRDQLSIMGIAVNQDEVLSVDWKDGSFTLEFSGRESRYDYVVVSTGTIPRRIDLEGVLYSIEDPAEFKGSRVLLIGGGDIAFDNSLGLRIAGIDVSILTRSHPVANAGLMRDVENAAIPVFIKDPDEIVYNKGSYHVPGIGMFDTAAAFIGRKPDLRIIGKLDYGDIVLPACRTGIEGLYVAGDAALGGFRQATLAFGTGIAAAMDIARSVMR